MKKLADVLRFFTSRARLPRGDDGGGKTQVDSRKEGFEALDFTLEDMGFTDLTAMFDKRKRVLYNRGRDDYFELVINTLLKKKKHNFILVGSSGVGKEAIIEGLAERIAKEKVPEGLQGKVVWKLNIDKFITGNYIEEDITIRMMLLHNILAAQGNVILYLYPMYVIPTYKVAADFKEAIEGTNTLVVGTLTQQDYQENMELFDGDDSTDSVDIISVIEPKTEEVYEMLKFKLRAYTRFHGVKMSQKAFDKCLSEVYRLTVGNLNLDSLIDYIDSALAIAKLGGKTELDYQSIFAVQKFQVREFFELSFDEKMKLAKHEAAHAAVGFALGHNPRTISIIPGDSYLGVNLFDEKYKIMTKSEYIDIIAVYVASIASTDIQNGEENNEAPGDLRLATTKAKNMILFYGMNRSKDSSLGKYQSFVLDGQFLEATMTDAQKAETSQLINGIIHDAIVKARKILNDDEVKEAQTRIAEALCQNASLTEEEARGLYEGTITVADLENANIAGLFEK